MLNAVARDNEACAMQTVSLVRGSVIEHSPFLSMNMIVVTFEESEEVVDARNCALRWIWKPNKRSGTSVGEGQTVNWVV